jgi:aerobic-type carbon monoxide dehydrogenase small subunit (CoxS/CutS family)
MLPCVAEIRRRKVSIVHSVQGRPAVVNLTLTVNGKPVSVSADDLHMPLLYALRNDIGLRGPRFGCGLAQCGACTVHVDGKPVRS